MARIFLALNCCMLFAILCMFSEVAECNQVSKRRDVHRIILKEKNRNRPKKHARPPPYHNDFSHGPFENPREPFLDQIGEYTNHHIRYHNRHPGGPSYYETPHNYYQNFEKFQTPYADLNFRPHMSNAEVSSNRHNHHIMDIEEFNKHQDGYQDNLRDSYIDKFPGDYERYRHLMQHYNKKNEEQFRIKMENSKQQNPYAEENLSAMATHNFPIAWQPQNSESFKGSWNPVSTLQTHLETKYTNNNKIKEFPQQNIEDIIELTTSKAYVLPSTIVETNFTKHKTMNFNSVPSTSTIYHTNHKYPKSKPSEIYSSKYRSTNLKNGSYQVHEENGDSGVSSVLGSFQNLAPAPSTSSYGVVRNPEKFAGPDQTAFGLRTKSRRTKRPASSTK